MNKCFSALWWRKQHFSSSSRACLWPMLISRKKINEQFCTLKREAESARKIASEDVEKAKLYGVTALSRDILEVVDIMEKAFDAHQKRLGAAEAAPLSASTGPSSFLNDAKSSVDEQQQQQVKMKEKGVESIYTGVKLSVKVLEKVLAKHGVEKIAVQRGDAFDPTKHEAVTRVAVTEDCPHETVAEVFRTGYMIKNRVLRATQVAVALSGEEEAPAEELMKKTVTREEK